MGVFTTVKSTPNSLVLRHGRASCFLVLLVTLFATTLLLLINRNMARAELSCVRHATDPRESARVEDIDCVLNRNAETQNFEMNRVSLYKQQGAASVPVIANHSTPGSEYGHYSVMLHRRYPADDLLLFSFHSLHGAEASLRRINGFLKDASISDQDMDELKLQYGADDWTSMYLCVGAAVALVAICQPWVEYVTLDGLTGTFRLERVNALGFARTHMQYSMSSISRVEVCEKASMPRGRGDRSQQRLAKVFGLRIMLRDSQTLGQSALLDQNTLQGGNSDVERGVSPTAPLGDYGSADLEVELLMGHLLPEHEAALARSIVAAFNRFLCDHLAEYGQAKRTEAPHGTAQGGEHVEREGASTNKGGYERPMCCICLETPPSAVLLPCGHVNSCISCASRLNACPSCRRSIERVHRVYL